MTTTLAICNQKGGVGKTTTVYHLARAAALRGTRTLVIDLDPQGTASTFLASEAVAEDAVSIADVLHGEDVVLKDVIVPGLWEGIDLAPTVGESLTFVRDELTRRGPQARTVLRDAISDAGYDLILIDCGPSLDYLTYNAFAAADRAAIVTQSQTAAILGLARLLETIRFVAEGDDGEPALNPGITVSGVLVNQHEESTISGAQAIEELRSVEGLPLIEPFIPKAVVIRDAMAAGLGLDQWPARQARRHAETYDNALTELLR